MMTAEKSVVLFVSKSNEEEGKELLKEKWYGTPYSIEKFDD